MFFQHVNEAQPDPIFGLLGAFAADSRKEKINLMVGIYKDDQLKAPLLNSVRVAQERVSPTEKVADYLPIDGLAEMVEALGPFVFGPSWKLERPRIYGAHVTGGTGALRAGAEFISQEVSQRICIPNHTWPNHRSIFERAGCQVETYSYYDRGKKGFDLEAMLDDLSKLPEKTPILLHPCCHNPTGCDPTLEEWKKISQLMKKKHLLPFFDFAYQGLGLGIEKDAEAIRLFLAEGHEMFIAYSCSKNFSMYCQRVGVLFAVNENPTIKIKVGSQIKRVIRALYSNPPAHGARVVLEVLKDSGLCQDWQEDLGGVRHRLNTMRQTLVQRLNERAKRLNFDYLKGHTGMFSFVDLNQKQVQRMIDEFAIYLTDNGRISVAGLTLENMDYVVSSLLAVCEER